MMGGDGGTVPPLFSGGIKLIFMPWIEVNLGLVDAV